MNQVLSTRNVRTFIGALCTLMMCSLGLQPAHADVPLVGYSSTDFIVADGAPSYLAKIAVYDQNFNFKGYLDNTAAFAKGLDILPNGNVVNLSDNTVRQFNPSGTIVSTFNYDPLGSAREIKASWNNRLYAAEPNANCVQEFTLSGKPLRSFGSKSYASVVVLPNGTLWADEDDGTAPGLNSSLDVYNIDKGAFVGTIPLVDGQMNAASMTYSPFTNTVLTTGANGVYEYTPSGAFVRQFSPTAPDTLPYGAGVTRGPNGDVYATSPYYVKVYHWTANGVYLGALNPSNVLFRPFNIIWMGNASTPNSSVNATGTLKNSNGSIQASLWAANNQTGLGGGLSYSDKNNKIMVQSTQVSAIVVQGNQARVYGLCKVNDVAGYSFTATVTDYFPTFLGRGDNLQLEVSNGYCGGGIFNPGDAKIAGAPVNFNN